MHAFRIDKSQVSGLVGLGARVLLLASDTDVGLQRQIAGMGGRIDREDEMYAGLSALMDDPAGWDLFVMACDGFGGLEAGLRAHGMLGAVAQRVRTILISAECGRQTFPEEMAQPILLRGPVSTVSLRVGMEHALRGKLNWHVGQ
ncbi:MAG: hypothetical protein DI533_07225 [Cereibacter sphaeroides]|uniref:Uncharacterized protein n=1 Tax=Cereibacter sphaeroides TaxID=1063 RepID=A0A2W5SDW2_CERSP|nr:MAG: hypothetical protein DI533_07225 [Cereibacter sphaeroides]